MNTSLKYRHLWIFSLAIVLLFSCRKIEINRSAYVGSYELSGTVLDELTGKPIPFADVNIVERSRESTSALGGKIAGGQIANENGEFVIMFEADDSKNYYEITAREDFNYFFDNTPPWVEFGKSGKGRQDITLMPKGYLTIHIKGNKGGHKLGTNKVGTWYLGVDTSKTSVEKPNKISKITYWVYDSNNVEIFKKTDSIFIPLPPDTAIYLIEF